MGAYFGEKMEFEPILDRDHLLSAWESPEPDHRIVKSHDWAHMLDDIVRVFPGQWLVLIRRDDDICYEWWQEAGGFNITYPNYEAYENNEKMRREISLQNRAIGQFAMSHGLAWSDFTTAWVEQHFGTSPDIQNKYQGIGITLLRIP